MSVYIVGITGGSGAPYALRLLDMLPQLGHAVKVVISPAGERVLRIETGLQLHGDVIEKQGQLHRFLGLEAPELPLELLDHGNLAAPISSGSFPAAGMVIVPCSMGSLGRIAAGVSTNLIERAADVMLKERRQLVLVPRETPLNDIHLQNMLAVRRAGADILPAMPGFYHHPKSVSDLVDMIVGKILDRLGIENALFQRWHGEDVDELLKIDDD
ncbi:MAG: UbiX family flavin prenyltransferase [Candidatus Latescibacteria bacterium]|nr:UbiX family flavin prenyltransferase [Candidatus Latescibacterota bacterium]NIM22687.1 UbiX family flavin prenyltransferase [Candidatus Latescibacterota bacterium]NIM64976.1 UbiX family flavin prenyltransferase [Candidatus Latescibacterota bacterium]NIO01491.1 UbiX family flavin prenyltransferase [Candidatus Latescibacterota bacterium]NIO28001.1 UbiX family flavin prenyltransferase [Candidatus Latescibacterota bacterium]